MERWDRRFNSKKLYIVHIHCSHIQLRMCQLCDEVLYRVSKAKYPGVLISNDLSWYKQVYKVATKANTTLHFIASNVKHCPKPLRRTAYCCSHALGHGTPFLYLWPAPTKGRRFGWRGSTGEPLDCITRTWRNRTVSHTVLLRQLQMPNTSLLAQWSA